LLFIYVDESPANWENVLEGIRKMYSIDTTGDREDVDIHPPKVYIYMLFILISRVVKEIKH